MSDAPIQHAFVSYVREDADAVDELVSILQAASIPVWKDTENLWPGEDWQQKIREAIEDGSLAFIACFSTSSVQKAKTYMNAELNLAVEQIRLMRPGRVWLLPIRLDDCELPNFDLGGNRTLDSLQRIDLFGPRREVNLARLVAAVMAIFGTSTTTPASAAAAIAGSGDVERGPLLAEALKAGVGDPGKQMELESLFLEEVRTTTQALKDKDRFPVTGGAGPTLTTLVARAQEYDGLVEPLSYAVITLGAWGGETDASLATRAMKSLAATPQDQLGGFTAYLDLRTYPVLPVLYAGALGAVARRNGRMLAAFTTDPIVTVNGRAWALPVAITPWRPFPNSEGAASLLARVGLEGGTIDANAQAFQGGRGPRYYTPLSEYLFGRLRPLASPYVLDDAEYEQLFHRTEALIALAELDWMAHNSDAVNEYRRSRSHWMGRHVHRERHMLDNTGLGHELLREIQSRQKAWWPLEGGMFGGDWARAEAAATAFIENEAQERAHRW
jgi:TIR domain